MQQATEMQRGTHQITHAITSLGGTSILDYSDIVMDMHPLTEGDDIPPLAGMRSALFHAHGQALLSIEAMLDVVIEYGDAMVRHVMVERLTAHRRHRFQ